ncbi:CD209 antigen-like protein D [Etheostoma spectabile]|uniref:CD209 antigen-like protein D n=1 Tax=Etheostoma spectabile TaxID=54343 RepID=UPI0013AF5EBC|nr:CD209 antigen-like protein D [Etheostoma spectabile]
MSNNIYEDPEYKYSKGARGGDGGERVERVIDIYESADTPTTRHGPPPRRGTKPPNHHLPAEQRNPFSALVLGFLCLLLVGGVVVLASLCEDLQLQTSNNQLQTSYNQLQTSYNNLNNSFCQEAKNQTHEWSRFRCSCYYKSTERKNWTESRRDCESRGADLVVITSGEENHFISELNKAEGSWIGLQSVPKIDWSAEWKWVDESTLSYTKWQRDVTINPGDVKGATAYMDQDGKWKHFNSGSKRWICEKHIY